MGSLDQNAIIAIGSRLPPSLGVLGRLQTLLAEPSPDLEKVVELVRIDAALTLQVIKIANSAFVAQHGSCDSLEGAVARVGFKTIHRIVSLAVAKNAFQGDLLNLDIAGGRLWENAVGVASLSAEFAMLADEQPNAAYTTGLLRNLGKVVLNNSGHAAYPGEAIAPDSLLWERESFGYSSAEVSSLLFTHWHFAPEMVVAMRTYREPVAGSRSAARLHLACAIVGFWGCALPGEIEGWTMNPQMLEMAGLPATGMAGAIRRAKKHFVQCALLEWASAA